MTALIRRNKKVVSYFSTLMAENKMRQQLDSTRKQATPRHISNTPPSLQGIGDLRSSYTARPPGELLL